MEVYKEKGDKRVKMLELVERMSGKNVQWFPNFVVLMILGSFSYLNANLVSIDRFFSALPLYYIAVAKYLMLLKEKMPRSFSAFV